MISNDSEKLIAFWTGHLNEQRKSGLSCAEYCRNNNLTDHQMTYWKRRLATLKKMKKNIKDDTPTEAGFAKALIKDQTQDIGGKPASKPVFHPQLVCLKLNCGLVIEISNSMDPNWVANLIKSLREV